MRKGYKHSTETKAKISLAQVGIWTKEARERQRILAEKQWTIEARSAQSKRGKNVTNVERKRRSEAMTTAWSQPDMRSKLLKRPKSYKTIISMLARMQKSGAPPLLLVRYAAGLYRREDTKRLRWEQWLWREYKLSVEDFAYMLHRQNWACVICRRSYKQAKRQELRFAVDHCHRTNKVRGILCGECNQIKVGSVEKWLEDGTVVNVIDYLAGRL